MNLEVRDEEHESKKDQVYVVAKQEPKMTPRGESVIADPPFHIPEDPAVADLGAGTGDRAGIEDVAFGSGSDFLIEKGKSWLINTSFPIFVLMEFWFQLQLHCGDHYGVHDGQRDAPDVRVHKGDGGDGGHALFE